MIFTFKRKIRKITSDTLGIGFPVACLNAILWLKDGNKINLTVTSDENNKTIIILSEVCEEKNSSDENNLEDIESD